MSTIQANARYLVLTIALAISFKAICKFVPNAYLDEVFHIPQTQYYCVGHWERWDPKISTPPGLYVLGVAYSKVLSFLRGYDYYCTVATLRNLNSFGVAAALPLVVRRLANADTAIAIASYPLLAFFGLLYYTDVWSTIFVLASLAIGKKNTKFAHLVSSILAAISITFRQTNIIWAGYVGLLLINADNKQNFYKQCQHLFLSTFNRLSITIPFATVASLFVLFVKVNNGVALGDKSNHELNINIPQLFYCSLFWAFFSWPLWLSPRLVRRYVAASFGTPLRTLRTTIFFILIAFIIDQLTIVHAFMLADNRHYTFYLWRRIIHPTVHPLAKFLMVPIYHACMWSFTTQLYSSTSILVATGLILSTAVSIIPSPLLEPRYYILTYSFWRIFVNKHHQKRLWAEFTWHILINAITVYVFLFHPFEWTNEPGNLQRFMW